MGNTEAKIIRIMVNVRKYQRICGKCPKVSVLKTYDMVRKKIKRDSLDDH